MPSERNESVRPPPHTSGNLIRRGFDVALPSRIALLYSFGESQVSEKALPDRCDGLHFSRFLCAHCDELPAQRRTHQGPLPLFQHAAAGYERIAAGLRSRCV